MIITILAFLIVLSILVLIHEFGHYITAKKFGIKVEEFGFGFPPRVLGKKIGETIYSINLLPIGGFVKLYGEDEAGSGSLRRTTKHEPITNIKRAFFARPAWQRALIVLAGVVMNFLLAVLIISYLFSGPGVALPTKNIRIVEVTNNSPAKTSGIQKGDEVLSVDDQKISDTNKFIAVTHSKLGKEITLDITRGGQELQIHLTPRKTYPKGEGPLGIAITNVEIVKYPWYQAPFYGTREAVRFTWMILSGLSNMVFDLVTKGQAPAGVAGPIGVAELTGEALNRGIVPLLWLISIISLNLAVVNVLPIPALDGGRLFFIMVEMVTRKKVSAKYEAMAHAMGLVVLLSLILLITLFDILRIFSGQSLLPKM